MMCLALDGYSPSTVEVYLNGELSLHRQARYSPRGEKTLFVGMSPDMKYHFYGRLYSLMVGRCSSLHLVVIIHNP